MTSPAQRHMMRVSAAMTAQREAAPLRHATVYEQMLVKLAADQRTLKAIYSKELKAAKKRELLPFWLPWVNGVLDQGKGAQDDILMTVMLWRLDTGDIAGALEIARYALKYGLTMPGKHRRTPPYMFTEEVALAAMRAHAAGESVDTRLLTETLELTATADMPDEVRAKLHKITGLFLRDAGDYGRTEGVVETVLAANPGLAELGAVLPHGTAVELPDVQTAPVAETVNLWE
ncbi:TPA: tail protein X [Escherichia coli]|nr:tail protein X [Escherichia coli]